MAPLPPDVVEALAEWRRLVAESEGDTPSQALLDATERLNVLLVTVLPPADDI